MKLFEKASIDYSKLKHKIEDTILDCIHTCKYKLDWLRYRTVHKYHIIDTKLAPGYHDSDTLIMHSVFSILVDYVEIEKAWMHHTFSADLYSTLSWFKKIRHLGNFRSAEYGVAYLNWEIADTDESQSKSAKEILDLYIWWTVTRPQRADPYVISGYDDTFINTMDDMFKDGISSLTYKNRMIKLTPVFNKVRKIEEQYDKEDEKMMIRLIKLRSALWT